MLTKHERLAILYSFIGIIYLVVIMMGVGSYLDKTCGG
ncbi:hypothetical protein Aci011_090 [Acinetobacter phage vB_AbaM_B09_Aci01-1]|uniref:Uncharacterized protein n=3 Tax=Saclayvirus TaxID=2733128 RepID=A0A386KKJ7_9CAUD|nr:hypothetical protein HOU29_gp091 [Acinetobacter phage vB_AbaM_B09_Aci01-1]YP_009813313.1 hypothetical protein HOU30_gp099 [Acinetobacter phage vB_AbaM_B09_Aci02-2]YP_009813943.1 hypothetical protein HOU35_gp088 [Acinetobacter phage vB_AbaM_B09_Aci05]AZF88490.1 hypothetical protein TAC_0102 [Acinetobacter phage TAC1]QMP19073.1 hypothetical protein FKOIJHOC_00125 [Acinetobacter phage Ab_121]QQV88789.1 hypothetical protein Liucustia_89 [Acinetobacter phage Liucustia]UYL86258.1 tail completion